MKAKIFQLAWGGYEGSERWLFRHEHKTAKQFRSDCEDAIRAVGPEYIKSSDFWISTDDWLGLAAKELEKHGYEAIRPISVWYTEIMIIEGDDHETEWREVIGAELHEKAIQKNLRMRINMDKDWCFFTVVDCTIYHSAECRYIHGKHVMSVPMEFIADNRWENLSPCKVCKPELEEDNDEEGSNRRE